MKYWQKELFIFVGALILVISLNGILVWAESQQPDGAITSFSEAFWYMVVTLTTVGYGDLYPVSAIGKIIGYLYVFSSIGLLGLFLSTVSNRYYQMKEEKRLGFKGTAFSDHVILFGWNDFSRLVLEGILHTKIEIAIVTDRKDDVDLIYDQYGKGQVYVLFADFHNRELYQKINASSSRMIFISLKEDSDTLMHVINFRKYCPDVDVLVSTSKSTLKETFEAAGVTHVVARNEIVSKLVASYIFETDVAELNLDLLSSSKAESDYDVMEFIVMDDNPYIGLDGHALFHRLKDDLDTVLLALRKNKDGKRVLVKNPSTEVQMEVGDYIIVMANRPIRKRLEATFGVQEGIK